MAIFKKKTKTDELKLVTKEIFIDSIKEMINEKFQEWHVISFTEEMTETRPYDLIVIRTFKKIASKNLPNGLPHSFHKDIPEEVQKVIVISCINKNKMHDYPEYFFDSTKKWVHLHLISDSLQSIYNQFKKIEESA